MTLKRSPEDDTKKKPEDDTKKRPEDDTEKGPEDEASTESHFLTSIIYNIRTILYKDINTKTDITNIMIIAIDYRLNKSSFFLSCATNSSNDLSSCILSGIFLFINHSSLFLNIIDFR
ncbi:MAG UNVERIFIED_CONTAM: hypothetical protein LVQ98_07960 [Rickettsiaceae bacterium]